MIRRVSSKAARAERIGGDVGYLVSHKIPRWHPFAPRHNEKGRAVFVSRAEINEFLARWNDSEWVETHGPMDWGASDNPDGTEDV